MNDNELNYPTYPYDIILDHGSYLVKRNTALVAEVLAIKERAERNSFQNVPEIRAA